VAWMDDGQQAANGTDGPAFRVVTDKTRESMPKAAVAPYNDALVREADALAAIKAARVQALAHAADLYGVGDVAAPVGNSTWGEAHQQGWIDGTQAYRDAIRRLDAGRGES
jgi:hypothetical protein